MECELAEGQIIPHLGNILLQKLRPARLVDWHEDLLKAGSRKGKPLSAQTVAHAHRVLHRALARAVGSEILSRNVAGIISPPKVRKNTYGHLFKKDDSAAVAAIEATLRTGRER